MSKKMTPVFILEQVIRSIRDFFQSRGFGEVTVPVFNTSLPLEPNLYAVKVGKYYLPTSPEATLKKAIAKGMGNCFAIGATFRDLEGSSSIHKPEFLMLEWYREDATYEDIMRETQELISSLHDVIYKGSPCKGRCGAICRRYSCKERWERISMEDVFREYAGLELGELCRFELTSASYSDSIGTPQHACLPARQVVDILNYITEKGYAIQNATWESIFNQIFLNEIEKKLPKEPFFLTDYPTRISPLCAKKQDKPYLTERFELYINGMEVANGNTENTDADEVYASMKKEEKYRKTRGLICPPVDMEFIKALKFMQKKSYAGIGLGVERLAMVLGNINNIDKLT